MIENKHLDLKSVKIHKVVTSDKSKRPRRAQVIFFLEEQIGSGKNKVIVRHSQTFHVKLESDGKYHYRNRKTNPHTVDVHFEWEAEQLSLD